ncbi:hypothetical protein PENSPDRAFT_135149 [Peniophora sp. CONT]|nr:hypothetical protein PENSPDRAFT_135149 [Peniophora sp. CONT]
MNNSQRDDRRAHATAFACLRGLLDRYIPAPGKKRKFLQHDWLAIERALSASTPEAEAVVTLKSFIPAYAPGSSLRKPYCQFAKVDWPQILQALNALEGPLNQSGTPPGQVSSRSTEHTTSAAVAPNYQHCVRCHMEFLENRPYGCVVPHVWECEGQFCGGYRNGSKLYEYKLACCSAKGMILEEEGGGNDMYTQKPKHPGPCFKGNHTIDRAAVHFNGGNIRECDAGRADDGICRLVWERESPLFDSSCLHASKVV